MTVYTWTYFWDPYSVPWSVCVFSNNLNIVGSISVKNVIGILTGIALNLYITLDNMDIIILPTYEHRISFHSFVSSLLSLIISSSFQYTRLSSPWLNLLLRYFILFDATINRIAFLIFPSHSSLFMHRNAREFSVLNLYHATWLNSFISSVFWWESLGFSINNSISPANSELHFFLCIILYAFISFSVLIALAGPSNTVLSNSGESGRPCLVPDFRGKAFRFSLSMLVEGLSYMDFIIKLFYAHLVQNFYRRCMLNFVKCLFCIYWNDRIISMMCITLSDWWIWTCIPGINPSPPDHGVWLLNPVC